VDLFVCVCAFVTASTICALETVYESNNDLFVCVCLADVLAAIFALSVGVKNKCVAHWNISSASKVVKSICNQVIASSFIITSQLASLSKNSAEKKSCTLNALLQVFVMISHQDVVIVAN